MPSKTSVFVANADTPIGYGLVDGKTFEAITLELLNGKHSDHFDMVVCTVKDIDYSGALLSKGACVIEMKDQNPPEWLGTCLKKCQVESFVLVPDCGSSSMEEQGRNLINLAVRNGIHHGGIISVLGSNEEKVKTAQKLRRLESECERNNYCIIQHALLEQCLFVLAPEIRTDMKIKLPIKADARCSLLDQSDLFHFMAYGLTKEGSSFTKSKTYKLTGPQVWTPSDVSDQFSKVLQEKIVYEQIDRSKMKEWLKKLGFNESGIEFMLDIFELINLGKQNEISHDEKKQTGQEARSFDSWLRENRHRFKREQ